MNNDKGLLAALYSGWAFGHITKIYYDIRDYIWLAIHEYPYEDRALYQAVMNNQRKYLNDMECENPPFNSVRVVKLVLDNLRPLRKLIGFQPFNKEPCTMIYSLQFKPSDDENMMLEIVEQAVSAGSLKLSARVPVEGLSDLLQGEFEIAVAAEVAAEIAQHCLSDLKRMSVKDEVITIPAGINRAEAISIVINRQGNNIARDTRRGAGNVVVMSPHMWAHMFLDLAGSKVTFEPAKEKLGMHESLSYAGTLNGRIDVLINTYSDDLSVMIGYKGNTDIDTGYVYSPYSMVMFSGQAIDPNSMVAYERLMTRGANTPTLKELPSSYYRNVNFAFEELLEENGYSGNGDSATIMGEFPVSE